MSEASSPAPASAPPLYGRFAVRLRGLVVDAAILAGFAVAVSIVVDVIESAMLSRILMPLLVGIVLLYDPVMVARFGGTIGHRVVNLRVADSRTEQRVGFFRALIRSILKTFLGLLSFFFMAITRRHQALHDLAAGTVVIIHDRAAAKAHEYAVEAEFVAPPGTVSGLRRVLAIAAYSIGLYVVNTVVLVLFLSDACSLGEACTPTEELILGVGTLLFFVGVGLLIVFGWRGKLPGARAKPADEAAEASRASAHDQAEHS